MHNIKIVFDKMYPIVKKSLKDHIDAQGNIPRVGRKPKFPDISIITLSLASESLGIDSENYLFGKLRSQYKEEFPNLIDRSQYNLRRRKLIGQIEKLRSTLFKNIIPEENIFIIDSMPLEICKISRSKRSKICRQSYESSPDKGYCSAQNSYFYGYKLHGICSFDGVFNSIDITKASVHDIHYLEDVKEQISNAYLLGDKAYLSKEIQIDLFSSVNISLNVPLRKNQDNFKKQPFHLRKARKRIETLFSQLCDQFMIRRNYAKTFDGFRTRILSKITAMTILQFINKFINYRPLGNIKYALA